jgi:2-hydroxychromene-2-carboxylate isomerase
VPLSLTLFSDPGCPWAYSAAPALTALDWRYGDGLTWRLVLIGLTEEGRQYEERGYTPARSARGYRRFRRYGMPLATEPRRRIPGTARACRAVVATRLAHPGREWEVFRALQYGWFCSPRVLDEDGDLLATLQEVPGIDPEAILAALDAAEVSEAYEADRAESRTAAGTPTEAQGKAAQTDGPVRYTAPSVILDDGERHLEAGGFQPLEAYDALVANLDPGLPRTPAPDGPEPVLARFPAGVSTQEVALVMTSGNDAPDRGAAEDALIELAAAGRTRRRGLGDDAVWLAA